MQNQQLERSVASLAGVGMSYQEMAALFGVPRKQIRLEHKLELRKGRAEGNLKVLDALHEAASSGKNMTATMFWLKARCGWRDTGPAQESNITRKVMIYSFSPKQSQPATTQNESELEA